MPPLTEAPGRARAANSFAWLNAEPNEPDAYHRLNAAGMAEWAGLERAVPSIAVQRSGMLHWPTAAAEDAVLDARCDRLQRLGYRARWITHGECAEA